MRNRREWKSGETPPEIDGEEELSSHGLPSEIIRLEKSIGSLSIKIEEILEELAEQTPFPVPALERLRRLSSALMDDISDYSANMKQKLSELSATDHSDDSTEMRNLLELIKIVNNEINLSRLQNLMMDIAIKLTKAERGFLLLEEDNGDLSFRVARNLDRADLEKPEFEVSRRIVSEVVRKGSAVIVNDALSDDRLHARQSIMKLRLRSILAVPLNHEGKVTGLLYLDNRTKPGVFTEKDARLLGMLAEHVAVSVKKAEEMEKLKESRENLVRELKDRYSFDGIITVSNEMQSILGTIGKVAPSDVTVLILGESGTGKELVAKALHANSNRVGGPFVFVNCAAIPESLLESELFGYAKGAFTGASGTRKGKIQSANNGTLFLDEIGDMAPVLQAKLLRVLQDKVVEPLGSDKPVTVDIRLVAATNRNLEEMVKKGEFRKDLYYRLNVITVKLPTLGERKEDIPVLVEYFLEKFCREQKKDKIKIPSEIMQCIERHDFPGNVRELENLVMRMVALTESGGTVEIDALPDSVVKMMPPRVEKSILEIETPRTGAELQSIKRRLTEKVVARLEREFLASALSRSGGNMAKAARLTGIDRRQLYRMAERSGFSLESIQ